MPFSLNRKTVISTDSSSFGMGCVLLQEWNGHLKPVAYASKALTETQQRYAQIEKEAYAIVWACERFKTFVTGLHFEIHTDHKPLVPLLSTKGLDELPLRIQRFKMRLMRYSYDIIWVPGKLLSTADALSRAPTGKEEDEDIEELAEEAEAYVRCMMKTVPVTQNKLDEISKCQKKELQDLLNVIMFGWPKDKKQLSENMRAYWQIQDQLSINENLIMKNNQIVVPPSLRKNILDILHQGHQGITKCKNRAKNAVWWPGINHQIEQKVQFCPWCIAEREMQHHPLLPTDVPNRPWQRVAVDLCEWKNKNYLVVMDYYSKFIELVQLSNISSSQIIHFLKVIFGRHGIPEIIRSDSGTQFKSEEWNKFSQAYGFEVENSSPHHHQSNGQAESGVKIAKNILKKCEDRHIGLLAYNTTPVHCGYSPSQLLMGRMLRTTLPVNSKLLNPILPNHNEFKKVHAKEKERQKTQYDQRHRVKQVQDLSPAQKVYIADRKEKGMITKIKDYRKYEVQTDSGKYIRNRRFLFPLYADPDFKEKQQSNLNNTNKNNENQFLNKRRREIRPPKRLIEEI